jgi:glycosyltransferase involved in cell wall biosynthesis
VDWFDPWSVIRLRRWLRRRNIQILHSHNPRDYYLAAVASNRTRVVNVGSRHHLRPLRHRYLKRPFLHRFAVMIAVSNAVRQRLCASRVIDPGRVVTIHNGIDVDRELPRRNGLRHRVDLDSVTPVVGYVGRLCPDKGVETLLEAIRLLREAGRSDLRVFVVGEDQCHGRYRRKLERMAHDLNLAQSVHFFGYVDDAARAAADFDVQVVCSRAEPFGLVTLEAMAHQHPVVATAAGGSLEIVRDGIDGFLVPPGDAPRLAEKLLRLLADPELRQRLGARGRARVVEKFSLSCMLDRTEAVYRAVLAGEPLPG